MARTADTKRDRFNFRWSPKERELIEQAAEEQGIKPTDFVRDNAYVAAQRVLADRTTFRLSDEDWRAFTDALDCPAVDRPRLRRLMTQPSVLEQQQTVERVARRA
jgi:uncharacterized protein (DUF1778 family)